MCDATKWVWIEKGDEYFFEKLFHWNYQVYQQRTWGMSNKKGHLKTSVKKKEYEVINSMLFFSLPVLSITFDTIKDQSRAKPHNAGILIWFATSLQNKKFLPWNLIFVLVKASRLFEIKAKVQWIIFLLWRKWTINVKFSVLRYKPGRCL